MDLQGAFPYRLLTSTISCNSDFDKSKAECRRELCRDRDSQDITALILGASCPEPWLCRGGGKASVTSRPCGAGRSARVKSCSVSVRRDRPQMCHADRRTRTASREGPWPSCLCSLHKLPVFGRTLESRMLHYLPSVMRVYWVFDGGNAPLLGNSIPLNVANTH